MFHSQTALWREQQRIAAHESAHCIARFACGLSIDHVSIVGRLEGYRTINGVVIGGAADDDERGDFSRIVVLVAGSIGEEVFLSEGTGLRGSDRRKALRYAERLASNSNAISLLIRAAEVEAEAILRQHELAFRNLVETLLARSRLTGQQVLEVIGQSI
ncbi:ATP-dependent Zn protease [Bradyrhizobium japonicum]|uniref:hypothetical protein n=1 Tax=Bradyrhizobium elkanii TaxID=29448 RepID=UPI0003781105|nr:hypothetical protein [Bradyrhizobium elkanii]GEC52659.1 hypothetical protein BEL01nite_17020 [Bradyrhizobium elkanii]